jgi:hypothetical protein
MNPPEKELSGIKEMQIVISVHQKIREFQMEI